MTIEKNITLDQVFDKLDSMDLSHKQHVELMQLIGAFGRATYSRGYEASTELHQKYKL